jgi:hypothetical protein
MSIFSELLSGKLFYTLGERPPVKQSLCNQKKWA